MTGPEALIWGKPSDTVILEIDHAPGLEPHPQTLAAITDVLLTHTAKRHVVMDIQPTDLPTGTQNLTMLAAAHHAHFDRAGPRPHEYNGDTVLHVMIMDAKHEEMFQGMYAPWRVGTLFLFAGASLFDRTAGPLEDVMEPYDRWERQVMVHELGHALGLVDCGIPMITVRNNPDSPCHSDRPESVMHAGYDDPGSLDDRPFDVLGERWHFDQYDIADIRAFRESEPG